MILRNDKNNSKNCHLKSGMSLVELMMVVAIISLLTSIVSTRFQTYLVRAKRVEAIQNLSFFKALVQSYMADQTVPETADAGPNPLQGSWYGVATDDFSTKISCQSPNVFGFHLADCRKARYSYWYLGQSSNWTIGAWNNGKICPNRWSGEAILYCPYPQSKFRMRKDAAIDDCADVFSDADVATCINPG